MQNISCTQRGVAAVADRQTPLSDGGLVSVCAIGGCQLGIEDMHGLFSDGFFPVVPERENLTQARLFDRVMGRLLDLSARYPAGESIFDVMVPGEVAVRLIGRAVNGARVLFSREVISGGLHRGIQAVRG